MHPSKSSLNFRKQETERWHDCWAVQIVECEMVTMAKARMKMNGKKCCHFAENNDLSSHAFRCLTWRFCSANEYAHIPCVFFRSRRFFLTRCGPSFSPEVRTEVPFTSVGMEIIAITTARESEIESKSEKVCEWVRVKRMGKKAPRTYIVTHKQSAMFLLGCRTVKTIHLFYT